MYTNKKFIISLLLLLLVILSGTIGYCLIEGWQIIDSFYMTLITVTTIGYSEVHTLSVNGRIFTSVLIIIGVGTIGYTLGSITQLLLEGEIQKNLGKRKMQKNIQSLTDHYIVCGYGKVGQQASKDLKAFGHNLIVIEQDSVEVEQALKDGMLVIENDATFEEILIEAGIKRAKALISTISSDASNVFITLSAKVINPNVLIIIRVEKESSKKKLILAGADRVISTDFISGRKMAVTAMRPNIGEFMEIITPNHNQTGYRIEEIIVQKGSSIIGNTLRKADLRNSVGVMIIGIKKNDGGLIFNPSADVVILENDILIAVGNSIQLKKMFELTSVY